LRLQLLEVLRILFCHHFPNLQLHRKLDVISPLHSPLFICDRLRYFLLFNAASSLAFFIICVFSSSFRTFSMCVKSPVSRYFFIACSMWYPLSLSSFEGPFRFSRLLLMLTTGLLCVVFGYVVTLEILWLMFEENC